MNDYIKPDNNIIIRNRPFDNRISDIFEYHSIKIKSVEELLLLIQGRYREIKKEIKEKKESDTLEFVDITDLYKLFKEIVTKVVKYLNKFVNLYNETLSDKENGIIWNLPKVEIKTIEIKNCKLGIVKPTFELIKYMRDYSLFLYKSLEKVKIDPYEIYGIKK
jgi:hypothetical protein